MNDNETSLIELKEKFELFVFEMDDSLEALIKQVQTLKNESIVPLDYSLASLDKIEVIYAMVLDGELELDESLLKTRLARYIGETFRKRYGGVWVLCSNQKDFAYGFPEVGNIDKMNPIYAFNPFEPLRIFKIRRRKGMIRNSVESHDEIVMD